MVVGKDENDDDGGKDGVVRRDDDSISGWVDSVTGITGDTIVDGGDIAATVSNNDDTLNEPERR